MILKYLSSYQYGPPLPVITLNIVNPRTHFAISDMFIIDSGADISSIKQELFDLLDLERIGPLEVISATGQHDQRFTSAVRIETPLGNYEPVKVVVEPDTDENLLGRDLINQWKVILDGPNQQMTIEV